MSNYKRVDIFLEVLDKMRFAVITVMLIFGVTSPVHAASVLHAQQELRQKFSSISLSYALDEICNFSTVNQKVDFLAGYINARWWLWQARTGVGKTIAKKMREKAWNHTLAGRDCSKEVAAKFRAGLDEISGFLTAAEQLLGKMPKSLLNPKPDQEKIFAIYQTELLGWTLAKKCETQFVDRDVNLYYEMLIAKRAQMLKTFRPDQLAGIEKNTNEMLVWGTNGTCTESILSIANAGYDRLYAKMPQKNVSTGYLKVTQNLTASPKLNFVLSLRTISCKEKTC